MVEPDSAEPIWKPRASVSRICRRRVYIDGPVAAATKALFDSLHAQRATLCGLEGGRRRIEQ